MGCTEWKTGFMGLSVGWGAGLLSPGVESQWPVWTESLLLTSCTSWSGHIQRPGPALTERMPGKTWPKVVVNLRAPRALTCVPTNLCAWGGAHSRCPLGAFSPALVQATPTPAAPLCSSLAVLRGQVEGTQVHMEHPDREGGCSGGAGRVPYL